MALCLTSAAAVTRLAVTTFTLAWTHSVERTAWEEDWRVSGDRLVLVEARVKGSGAGMEPGDDAVLDNGWWRWRPERAVASLTLARSAAAEAWRLCSQGACRPLDGETDPLVLRACE